MGALPIYVAQSANNKFSVLLCALNLLFSHFYTNEVVSGSMQYVQQSILYQFVIPFSAMNISLLDTC